MVTNRGLQGSRCGSAANDVDRWFGRVFGVQPASVAGWSLPTTVWEENDQAYIELELPGVAKEDLDITVEQGIPDVDQPDTGAIVAGRAPSRAPVIDTVLTDAAPLAGS